MIVSDEVFSAAASANGSLSQLYGMALRLDGITVSDLSSGAMADDNEEETIESAFAYSERVRQRIWKMRDVMRKELGISSAEK
jgi:hypothetical protein